ncbi:hypothetical protein M5K25_000501 [Dendrobium thyrsiflorum]|uniref:Uncharacterized protein n=1 Tax=Dendrobium thyrsiflorum TaxID=117978 RepID=A0ABD0VVL7_DENTH
MCIDLKRLNSRGSEIKSMDERLWNCRSKWSIVKKDGILVDKETERGEEYCFAMSQNYVASEHYKTIIPELKII